jgi:hypothetical protein
MTGATGDQARRLVVMQSQMCCAALRTSLTHHWIGLEPKLVETDNLGCVNGTHGTSGSFTSNNGGHIKDNVFLLWQAVHAKFKPNNILNVTSAMMALLNLTYQSDTEPAGVYQTLLNNQRILHDAHCALDDRVL